MKVRRFAQVVAAAALATCGSDPVPYRPLFSLADTVSRVKSAAVFDTLWAFGGPDDTLLVLPAMPRPDGSGGVVFVDVQSMKVHRIGGEGTLLWSWGRKGEGPGEIKNVRAMDVRDDGSVVLVDSGNRRIVTLDSGGKLIGETGFLGRTVHSVASLSTDKLAVHSTSPLWGVLEGGKVQEAEPPPGTSPSSSVLQHQGHVVRWREDKWVFGYGVGNGWMVFADDALVGVHPYVEHMEVPAVGEARPVAPDLWLRLPACDVRPFPCSDRRHLACAFRRPEGPGRLQDRQIQPSDGRVLEHRSAAAPRKPSGHGRRKSGHRLFGRSVPAYRGAGAQVV